MAVAPFPLPAGLPVDPALLPTLLALLPMGVIYYTPVLDAAGTLTDLTLAYLNPAAQRMTQLPAQPAITYRQQFPTTDENGAWDFHRRSWLGPEPAQFQFYYDEDGFDSYFRVVAQRLGEGLLVIFTDTQHESRSEMEKALRASQAREQERARQLAAAQAATEREQAQLQALLAQAPVAIALYQGPEAQVTLVNARMAALWGYTPEQVLGRPLLEGVPELQGQGFDDLLRQVQASRTPYVGTEAPATMQRNGVLKTTYYNFVYQPLFDADAHVLGVINVAVEVTEQVLARQQLEQLNTELEQRVQARTRETLALQAELLAAAQRQAQAREELYQVFEQAPVVVALLRGPEHFFHYRNPAFQGLFPGRALTGRFYAEAMPEIVAAGLMGELDRVYVTGQPYFGMALPVVTAPPNGAAPHLRYYDFSYQPYREDGRIVGISIFAYDVTEQVLTRQQGEAQQQLLSTVFEQAPAGIWVVQGPEYVFEVFNPAMGRILGHAPAQSLGRSYFEVLPELLGQGMPELLRQVWEQGEAKFVEELPAQLTYHAPGELGYFTFVFQPLHDELGQVARISCVALDVTAQVVARRQVQVLNEELASINKAVTATNAELHESNRQLTRTNVDLDTFVYTASHDLKAPITNIESLVLALRNTLPAPVQQDELIANLLDLLDQTTARFQFTIAQLTDLSKLQLAHAGPAEPVNLAAVVEAVRLDLVPALESAAAQLTVEVAPELVISFSPANLRSTIYNLLSNAVKYRAPDRPAWVVVRARRTGLGVVLEVQDNGLGLNAHQQSRLFGLFQRLHTHVEGTGVGLYITKRLVENGGGHIEVASQPNVGTTFTVTLPT